MTSSADRELDPPWRENRCGAPNAVNIRGLGCGVLGISETCNRAVQRTYELADGSAKVKLVVGKLMTESAIASNSREIARLRCATEPLRRVLP